jgi:hypothetical protein
VTTDSVLEIVHIGREEHLGMSVAVSAYDKKMFSVTDVSGLEWNISFGSVISQTTFYRKSFITCRIIKLCHYASAFHVSYLSAISFHLQLYSVHLKIACMLCELLLWDFALFT